MIYILGVITGLLLAVLSIAALTYLKASTGQPERFLNKVAEKAERSKAVIIEPKSQASKVQEAITKEYEDRGEEAPLIL